MGMRPNEKHARPADGNTTESIWGSPPEDVPLAKDHVDVWRASLMLTPGQIEALSRMLSQEENERLGRLAFRRDQDNFVATHGILRMILSRYCGVEPHGLTISQSQRGKPCLAGTDREVRFNASRSGELALYAVASGREVGVDIERICADAADGELAEKLFAPGEAAALRALSDEERVPAFFSCWSRKEAFVKALGRGFSLDLTAFEVSVSPDQPAVIVSAGSEIEYASKWSLRDLRPGAGYAAAICAEGQDWELVCWDWPEDDLEAAHTS
jgi:4'-phosphopantetheinyl transferase